MDQSKIDFICELGKAYVNYTKYILFVFMAFGIFFCCGSTIVFCRFRNKYNIHQEEMQDEMIPQQRRRLDPAERARMVEEQNKLRVDRLKKLLKKTKYGNSKHKKN